MPAGAASDDRRGFLLKSFSASAAAWLTATWPAQVAAAEAAHKMGGFTYFTPQQAREIDAMAAQIYPTTDTPGAREAQVIYFIDLGLVTFAADKQPVYAEGFGALTAACGGRSFAALPSGEQIKVLTSIETTPFFKTVRDHTVMGMFSAPQHGGNFHKTGWQQIGFDDSLNFRAPFGAYDRA
jgi:gluconate 2-dehydrogenase gamma chain